LSGLTFGGLGVLFMGYEKHIGHRGSYMVSHIVSLVVDCVYHTYPCSLRLIFYVYHFRWFSSYRLDVASGRFPLAFNAV